MVSRASDGLTPVVPIVGRSLRHFMTRAELTVDTLAVYVGVQPKTVQRWRCRKNQPTASQLNQIAALLRLDAADYGALLWWWGSRS